MLTNAPVTVYHFDAEQKAYIALSFLDAHVFSEKKATFSGARKQDETHITVRIPINASDALSEDETAPKSTISPGDYLMVGLFKAPGAVLKECFVSAVFSGVYDAPDKAKCAVITGVTEAITGTNPHIKVTAATA